MHQFLKGAYRYYMKRNINKLNEDATAGATNAGGIATVVKPLSNLLQRRLPSVNELITNIYKKPKND